jgi:histidine ammonia-lyase
MSRDTITALRQQLDTAIAARIEELLGTRKAIDAELAELRGHRRHTGVTRRCRLCGEAGHNARSCPSKGKTTTPER